ncbi:MAG: toll/interleukin-1 receptor domain-containing protein, partial [Caulobacterales bacterium]|nr:toll/interleukin-1 receptor domain-containing protein [Caulobacterales bacterium]
MADIFISYTQADMEKAAIVAAGFASERRTVFYDVNVAPGDSWDHRIEQELASAKAVVVLWSNASRERQWVRNEARDAMQRGVLCPALIDDCAIPIEFSHVQAADLRGMTSTAGHAGWAQLTTAVAAMLGEAAGAPSSPTESEAPSGSASGDLGLLHPAVRAAVARARDTAVMSERAAAG